MSQTFWKNRAIFSELSNGCVTIGAFDALCLAFRCLPSYDRSVVLNSAKQHYLLKLKGKRLGGHASFITSSIFQVIMSSTWVRSFIFNIPLFLFSTLMRKVTIPTWRFSLSCECQKPIRCWYWRWCPCYLWLVCIPQSCIPSSYWSWRWIFAACREHQPANAIQRPH